MTYRRYALGQVTGAGPAGEINGVSLLLADLRALSARANEFLPAGAQLDRSRFERLMADFRPREGEDFEDATERLRQRYREMTGPDVQALVLGTVEMVGRAIVRAKGLSLLLVADAAGRAQNQAAQASVIEPARLMWDSLSQMIRNMEQRRDAGQSGLGLAPAVVAALIVAGAILGAAVIAGGVYLADGHWRLQTALREARRICNERGGCTPEQEAALVQTLRLGPFDALFTEAGKGIGRALETSFIVGGVAAGAVVAGLLWYYAFGGRRWVERKVSGGGR